MVVASSEIIPVFQDGAGVGSIRYDQNMKDGSQIPALLSVSDLT